jgi:hypothetical protein
MENNLPMGENKPNLVSLKASMVHYEVIGVGICTGKILLPSISKLCRFYVPLQALGPVLEPISKSSVKAFSFKIY